MGKLKLLFKFGRERFKVIHIFYKVYIKFISSLRFIKKSFKKTFKDEEFS